MTIRNLPDMLAMEMALRVISFYIATVTVTSVLVTRATSFYSDDDLLSNNHILWGIGDGK